jgi:hypothetical protein
MSIFGFRIPNFTTLKVLPSATATAAVLFFSAASSVNFSFFLPIRTLLLLFLSWRQKWQKQSGQTSAEDRSNSCTSPRTKKKENEEKEEEEEEVFEFSALSAVRPFSVPPLLAATTTLSLDPDRIVAQRLYFSVTVESAPSTCSKLPLMQT